MLREISTNIHTLMKVQIPVLKKFVADHYNFIDLQDEDNDTIFGYLYINSEESVIEQQIKAIAIFKDRLCIYLEDYNILCTEEDMKEDSPNWHTLDIWSNVMFAQTLLNILEFIEEYV